MERLPNEIWQNICYYSNIKTLKTLRLVHPIFTDLAARVLFHTVYVAVFFHSLQKLFQIASHPVLCLYVHKIMFQRQVLDSQYCNYQIWLETIDLRAPTDPLLKIHKQTRKVWADAHYHFPDIPLPDDVIASVDLGSGQTITVSEKSLMQGYSRYRSLSLQQHYLFPPHEIDTKEMEPNAEHQAIPKQRYLRTVDHLSYAVSKLINLYTVETFEEPQQVEYTHRAAWDPEGAPRSLLSRLQHETLLKFPFKNSKNCNYICNPTVASQPIIVLLKALFSLDRRTSSSLGKPKFDLTIDALPWSFWMQGFASLWARDSEAVLRVLSRLRSLDIHFCIACPNVSSEDISPVTTQMTEFMNGLKQVEHLKVTFKDPNLGRHLAWMLPLPDSSEILQQISLPRLSDLSIGDCSLNEEALVTFMQRHCRQLKRFNGVRLNLSGAWCSWRSAIQRIAPVMSLDVAHLRCLLDDEIMTVKDADAFRVIVGYDNQASVYLKLKGHIEYPSMSALASETPLNPDNEAEGSHATEV